MEGNCLDLAYTHEIATVGELPRERPSPRELLRARILEIVGSDDGLCPWAPERLGYFGKPGAWRWWGVRAYLGGRVRAADMRAVVNELLADGELLEVWLEPYGRRDPKHLLVLPGRALPRAVVKARGRRELLAEQPWEWVSGAW